MFTLTILCVSFLALGLYAGKRREKGMGWHEIACEFANSVWNIMSASFDIVSKPFRKGRSGHNGNASHD